MNYYKTLKLSLLLLIILFALMQLPSAYSYSQTKEEKATTFLQSVIALDLAMYESKLLSKMDFQADMNGVAKATLLYNLKAQGSRLEVIYNFRNDVLVSCNINSLEGKPLVTQPMTSQIEAVRGILERYQSFSKSSYAQSIRSMLNDVTDFSPMTVSLNDVKMTVDTKDYLYIEWMKTPNGILNMYDRIIIAFQNDSFKMFTDSWDRYPIGSADVQIPKEQAINIAKNNAQSFSYEIGETSINNLTIAEKPEYTQATLTMQPRDNALYPHWEVTLPLDQVYPGITTSIRVALWADNGNVISVKPIGSLGMPLPGTGYNSEVLQQELTPQTIIQEGASDNQPLNAFAFVAIAASVTIVVLSALALRRRKK